jgi:hypothetical protein
MVLRFAFVAALIAAALVMVQQKQVLQNAGLTGYCTQVATPRGKTGIWHACYSGKLTGAPGLERGSCHRVRHRTEYDLWRCPVELERGKVR